MSQHHRAQKWTTHAPKLRTILTRRLPTRCLNCPHLVTADQTWQVGHRLDAAKGGRPTIANAGPSHAWCPNCRKRCNQVAGGKAGAAKTNARRRAAKDAPKDIRPW